MLTTFSTRWRLRRGFLSPLIVGGIDSLPDSQRELQTNPQPDSPWFGVSNTRIPTLASLFIQMRTRFAWEWAALFAIASCYLMAGLVGHDPWKQDETYIFGIIYHMLQTGDWIVPTMAGEPFMEKPPLYYWVAAMFARSFSPWLPLHDGARLATGLFMAVTCVALAWTMRQWAGWTGRGNGRLAILSLLSCLGLVFHGHLMLTDVPLLTGFAIASAGLIAQQRSARLSGCLLGTGVGVGFMAKGVLALGVFGITCVMLPLLFVQWRQRKYAQQLMWALLFATPWLLIWPIALYVRSYDLFVQWFWMNNVGRFFGFAVATLGAPHTEGFWITTLPWFTFPALPLAVLTLWRRGKHCLDDVAVQVCLLVAGVLLLVLGTAASARDNYALPLLLPLSILAAPSVRHVPKLLDRYLDWSARALFGAVIALIWIVWVTMVLTGSAPQWDFLTKHLPSHFQIQFDLTAAGFALAFTLLGISAVRKAATLPGRGVMTWGIGIALSWTLMGSLWLPWVDYAKSYRGVFSEISTALPQHYNCVASQNLGESERAMMHYFLGIKTLREEINKEPDCDVLVVAGLVNDFPAHIDHQTWTLVWDGARPGDARERVWVFKASYSATQLADYD